MPRVVVVGHMPVPVVVVLPAAVVVVLDLVVVVVVVAGAVVVVAPGAVVVAPGAVVVVDARVHVTQVTVVVVAPGAVVLVVVVVVVVVVAPGAVVVVVVGNNVVLGPGAVVVVAPPGGQGFVEQSPGPTLSPPWALHSAGVRSMQVSRKAPIGDDCSQHWVCACVVVVVVEVVVEVVVAETGATGGVEASDPQGSAAHEPFDVVPTQTLPPRGARHAAARRKAWQCVTPLASVRQHRTALGRPQVEPAAQARSCALHPSESVPLLTAARATPATQRT